MPIATSTIVIGSSLQNLYGMPDQVLSSLKARDRFAKSRASVMPQDSPGCKQEHARELEEVRWAQQGMILRPPDYESVPIAIGITN
jgi:hypothetical protein